MLPSFGEQANIFVFCIQLGKYCEMQLLWSKFYSLTIKRGQLIIIRNKPLKHFQLLKQQGFWITSQN